MFITRHSKQRSYGIEYGPRGNIETDGIVCAHCGCNDEMTPGRDPADFGARCTCCNEFICYRCRGKGCMPLEYRLEQYERRGQGLRYDTREELFAIFEKIGGRVL